MPLRAIRLGLGAVAIGWFGLLSGCATTQSAGAPASAATGPDAAPVAAVSKEDPWERWNRKVYSFNDALDTAVLKPVATTYVKVVPQPIRTGVNNFYGNFADAWSAVNNVLQGKVIDGFQDVMRVGTNTVFGLAGFIDVASEIGLDKHNEDFGQTLGRWGIGAGPYVVWPILGPSTARDSFAVPLDLLASPSLLVQNDMARGALTSLGVVNERANLLPTTRMLDDMALDKYTFVRDAYLQRRRSLIYDGNEPEESEAGPPLGAEVSPPGGAASAPVAMGASAPAPAALSASSPAPVASQPGR